VRGVPAYTIPPSNPFTQTAGYRHEIWALGLRNPWRFSFDRLNGDLYIGDVGQDCWEEIDYQPGTSHGGKNYGWRIMEGFRPFNQSNFNDCFQPPIAPPGLTLPITAYGRDVGNVTIGGYVYRGHDYPWMSGVYFYGDTGSGRIWAIEQTSPGVWSGAEKIHSPYSITSFGEDEQGELYVTDYGGGRIYKIVSTTQPNFSTSTKRVSSAVANFGGILTYTIVLRNSGSLVANTSRVTDVVPNGLNYRPGSFAATRGTIDTSAAPTLRWSGAMSATSIVTLTYAVTVATASPRAIVNDAIINPGLGTVFNRLATVVVNGWQVWLPPILKNF
jgi:uncharacterized repeat protein (TIGR01451 family)